MLLIGGCDPTTYGIIRLARSLPEGKVRHGRERHREARRARTHGSWWSWLYVVSETDWIRFVQAMASGDEQALRMLFERTHRLVFTVAMRITHNRETAEEVTLDVFHDVWRRAATYDPAGGSVVGWIMNQARSRAIDRLRRDQRKKRGHGHAAGALPSTAPSSPHDAVAAEEQGRRLRAALAVLTFNHYVGSSPAPRDARDVRNGGER